MKKDRFETVEVLEYDIEKGYKREVDKCIAPLIRELNKCGVKTMYCCCGHGNVEGFVRISGSNIRFVHLRDEIAIDLLLKTRKVIKIERE
jgi:formylmethanofuran dehydrogenase subunit B